MPRRTNTGDRGISIVVVDGVKRYRIRAEHDGREVSRIARLENGQPAATKADARLAHRKLLAELEGGTYKPLRAGKGATTTAGDVPRTLRVALDEYIDAMRVKHPRTIGDRATLAKTLVRVLGDVSLDKLSPFTVQTFQTKRAKEDAAPATINRAVVMLRHACRLAVRANRGWMTRERLAGIDDVELLQEPPGRRSVWTGDELAKLRGGVNAAVWRVVQAAYLTAMRQGEILTLLRSAVDLDGGTITLRAEDTKTTRARVVAIEGEALPALIREALEAADAAHAAHVARHPNENPARPAPVHVFCNLDGEPFARSAFPGYFHKLTAEAGIEGRTFHDLRRTAGTNMVNAGVGLHVVSRILGHSSTAVTERSYAHLDVASTRGAMAALSTIATAKLTTPAKAAGVELERSKPSAAVRLRRVK